MQSILHEAYDLINGPRAEAYGPPEEHFAQVAKVWTGQLMHKLKPGVEITAQDVCHLMAELKMVRESHKPKRDNRRDAAGYLGCSYKVAPDTVETLPQDESKR